MCVFPLFVQFMCHSPSILLYAKHMFEMQKSAYRRFVSVNFVSVTVCDLPHRYVMFAYHDVVTPKMSESVILSIRCEIR